MSQQAVNTTALPGSYSETTGRETKQLVRGDAVVAVRVDDLPEVERDRLAAEGKWHPLTVDPDGNLRVVLPGTVEVETKELEVLRDSQQLLTEIRDLLRRIA